MSDNNNGVMIAGLIVAYLYLKRNQAGAVAVASKARQPLPVSMPGSVGTGSRQVVAGALQGLLLGLAAAPANNTSQTYFQRPMLPDTSGVVQEAVDYSAPGVSDLIDTTDMGWFA